MDKEFIEDISRKYRRIFLTLSNDKIFSGEIKKFGNDSFVLEDRNKDDIIIKYSAVIHIEKEKKKKQEDNKEENKNGRRN